jgi:hypothetical protein
MRNNRLLFHFLKKYFPNFFKKPSTLFIFPTQCLTTSRLVPESAKLPNSKVAPCASAVSFFNPLAISAD